MNEAARCAKILSPNTDSAASKKRSENMKLTDKVKISPDVLFQEVSGETVLLDLNSESYFGLDETATRIWQLLQQEGELQQVLETMLSEFDVSAEQMEKDLIQHLSELESSGLVSVEPGQAA